MRDYAGKKIPSVFTLTYARPSALVFGQQSHSSEKHYAGCRRNHQVQDAGVRFKAKYAGLLKLETYELCRLW